MSDKDLDDYGVGKFAEDDLDQLLAEVEDDEQSVQEAISELEHSSKSLGQFADLMKAKKRQRSRRLA